MRCEAIASSSGTRKASKLRGALLIQCWTTSRRMACTSPKAGDRWKPTGSRLIEAGGSCQRSRTDWILRSIRPAFPHDHVGHVLPHHIIDVMIGREAKAQRPRGVERARPAADDPCNAGVGFAAHE